MNARIDVHSHHYPRAYLDALRRRESRPRVYLDGDVERFVIFPQEDEDPRIGRAITAEWTTIAGKTDFMDEHHIERSVISLGNPWFEPFDGDGTLELVREVNEETAHLEKLTNGRLVGLGALPATSIADVLNEIRWIDEEPGLRGVVTGPRIAFLELDDPKLEPVWDDLEQRGLPVLLHPQDGVGLERLRGYGHTLPVGIGFPTETAVAVCRMVFAGILHDHPRLRLIVSHGGGTLSSLTGRLDAAWLSDELARHRLPEPPSRSISRLYVDAITYSSGPLLASIDMVGADRIMFGTDHPFSIEDSAANVAAVEQNLTEDLQHLLFAGTATQLFELD